MKLLNSTITALVLPALILLLVLIGLANLQNTYTTRTQTIETAEELSIDARQTAFTDLAAPYKTMHVFISNEESADFKFTSVGGSWQEDKPEGTNVEVQLRFKSRSGWSEWLDLEEEEDPLKPGYKVAIAPANPSTAMQYKFNLYGDGIHSPSISNSEWTFIRSGRPLVVEARPEPAYASSNEVQKYLALASNEKDVIARSRWGADESYRYLPSNDIEPVLIDIDPELRKQFAEELKYSNVIKKDYKGDKYRWPLQYPTKVKKIVVHHTAGTANLNDPMQAIRDIYHFHADSRQWGDIGYNYIIDQDGRVYEGRYGGDGVIGAHAGLGNNGSIGIAVLGNYEQQAVPERVIASLGQFISKKAAKHKIDPDGFSNFRGRLMPNIFGHKDIMATSCPGINLYEKLPILRTLAAQKYQAKKRFVKDYDYEDQSELAFVELKPEEEIEVTVKIENIGKVDWDEKTFIVVNDNPDVEKALTFPSRQNSILAMMKEKKVKPGKTATFKFKIKARNRGETVYLDIAPLINGRHKIDDYIVLPVAIQQNDFKYEFIDSKYPAKSMDAGVEFSAWVKLKNTGNTTWRNTGNNTVYLGTDHKRDRQSDFVDGTRIGFMEQKVVEPGETATFNLNLKAPTEPGYYQEYFTPVVEGITWMSDSGMYFETVIIGDEYAAEVIEMSPLNQFERGSKYVVWMKLRNIGKKTWTKKNMKMVFLREQDLKITDASLSSKEVKTGEMGTIRFVVHIDENEDIEGKNLMVRPKIDGKHLYKRPIYFYYTVGKNSKRTASVIRKASGTTKQEDIRIKLSYEGNPQITASDAFEIYSANKFLTVLNGGKSVSVQYKNNKYEVTTPSGTFQVDDEVRFIPKNNGILKIQNYNNRPSWNTSINDNEYRGKLEVRYYDGKLLTINELPLEDYLKGLGEVSNTEETEKIKAIMVSARSYAQFYMTVDTKFPGAPYHLDDDPARTQKYIGYGFEKRGPKVVQGIEATTGQVITYNGTLVKTPYFNQSDGTRTRSAKDVWNWDAGYLLSVDDSYCTADNFLGHGVGLSGCGAHGMALQGFSYSEILKHYFSDIEIVELY